VLFRSRRKNHPVSGKDLRQHWTLMTSQVNPDDGKTQLLTKSLTQLGWGLIQKALADRAVSPVTAVRCQNILPGDDFESAQYSLEETAEMVALHRAERKKTTEGQRRRQQEERKTRSAKRSLKPQIISTTYACPPLGFTSR